MALMYDTGNISIGGATIDISAVGGTYTQNVGYIKDGITITPSFEVYEVGGIEGLPVTVKVNRTKTQYTLKTTLMEPTLGNVAKVWDITSSPTSPMKIDAPAACAERKVKVTSNGPASAGGSQKVWTWEFTRCVVQSPEALKIGDAEESKLPVSFICLYDTAGAANAVGTITIAA
jgi:hypothetical protein